MRCSLPYSLEMNEKPIRLIPYMCGCGAFSGGAESGPLVVAQSSLLVSLRRKGLDVDWWRDPVTAEFDYKALGFKTRPPAGSQAREDVVRFHLTQLCDDVEDAVKQGYRVVTIGGDHSMAIGSVTGLTRARKAHGKTGLLWIDAHPDIHTMKTSRRKTFHAVPVSALLGEGGKALADICGAQATLNAKHIAYVGLRSIDEPEIHQIARHKIKTYTNGDLDQFGLRRAMTDSIAHISKGTRARFLSIDLDGIDPEDAPGVGSPVPGGLKAAELIGILKTAGKKADFDVIEITEFNPRLDKDGKTAVLIGKILTALLA